MGVKRGRRQVGGVVITCSSRARREGSPRSRARAVGHEIGFRAQRSDYPYNGPVLGIIKGNPGVIQADPDLNLYETCTHTQGRGFWGLGSGFLGQWGQPWVSGFMH